MISESRQALQSILEMSDAELLECTSTTPLHEAQNFAAGKAVVRFLPCPVLQNLKTS